ncbi:DUF5687 family protein [Sediminibacterium sp.]|uniref:DUF5687 family protein n=1 Tax=Sediminibacterium sp. TaxID=1917865 RepID=UPI0025E7CF3D|nr:DUF5687 family protein [Sediminibacterium sp.]MDO8995868.1 DUF5687 family protein [Sediminibacterium sp.]MDP2422338.1 DUF5687 family protein [Sediminibacterium sp.]
MMLFSLIVNETKKIVRSRHSGASLFGQIFIGFLIVYLLSSAIVLGAMLNAILYKFTPGKEFDTFCVILLYYFLIDIPLRYWFQELPTLSVKPYLIQNVKKSQLINFLNLRSLLSLFNLIPLVLFIPFMVGSVLEKFGASVFIAFLVCLFFLMLANHFMIIYLKRKSIINTKWLFGFVLVIASIFLCTANNIFSISAISVYFFPQLINNSWLALIPVLFFLWVFLINRSLLRANFYLDIDANSKASSNLSLKWTDSFGELISNELKLIFRNKRPRNTILMSFIFLLYGFMIYDKELFDERSPRLIIIVMAYMITGLSSLNYMQFLFSWQTAHIEQLMISKHGLTNYVKSKLSLVRILNTFPFIISLFYGIIDWRILPLHIALFAFNIGLILPLGVLINVYNTKGIDISKSANFNYQGVGLNSFLTTLIPLLLLMGIYGIVMPFFGFWSAVVAIGIVGFIPLFLQNWWINQIAERLKKQKYSIIAGFREK